jgi:hypothetical protein
MDSRHHRIIKFEVMDSQRARTIRISTATKDIDLMIAGDRTPSDGSQLVTILMRPDVGMCA